MRINYLVLLSFITTFATINLHAQERKLGREYKKTDVSRDGTTTFDDVRIKVSGEKCVGSWLYSNTTHDLEDIPTTLSWSAKKESNGTVCTSGVWQNSTGSGKSGDIFINKQGKAFRLGR